MTDVSAIEVVTPEEVTVEQLSPTQRLHAQYNEASAMAEALKDMISYRLGLGEDCSAIRQMLQEAEAKRNQAQEALTAMGKSRILSRVRTGKR